MPNSDVQTRTRNINFKYLHQINPEDAEVIFDFFVVFSRFEFALKHAGYLKGNRDKAEPDWDKYCTSVQDKFDKTSPLEFQEACGYYTSYPPKKQVVIDGQVEWKENQQGSTESEFRWIIRSVKTVRNNLFHGGKFPYMPLRDTRLLSYALVILHECMKYDRKVEREFTTGHM